MVSNSVTNNIFLMQAVPTLATPTPPGLPRASLAPWPAESESIVVDRIHIFVRVLRSGDVEFHQRLTGIFAADASPSSPRTINLNLEVLGVLSNNQVSEPNVGGSENGRVVVEHDDARNPTRIRMVSTGQPRSHDIQLLGTTYNAVAFLSSHRLAMNRVAEARAPHAGSTLPTVPFDRELILKLIPFECRSFTLTLAGWTNGPFWPMKIWPVQLSNQDGRIDAVDPSNGYSLDVFDNAGVVSIHAHSPPRGSALGFEWEIEDTQDSLTFEDFKKTADCIVEANADAWTKVRTALRKRAKKIAAALTDDKVNVTFHGYNATQGLLKVCSTTGPAEFSRLELGVGEGVAGRAFKSQIPTSWVLLDTRPPNYYRRLEGTTVQHSAVVSVPIFASATESPRRPVIGSLSICTTNPQGILRQVVSMAQFAGEVAPYAQAIFAQDVAPRINAPASARVLSEHDQESEARFLQFCAGINGGQNRHTVPRRKQ